MSTCRGCGTPNRPGRAHCIACGEPLEAEDVAPEAVLDEIEATEPAAERR
jgi:uncharacterized OB-fold protein